MSIERAIEIRRLYEYTKKGKEGGTFVEVKIE